MTEIVNMHHFDIYAEIAKVCPSQSDLKRLPNEEITQRIHSFTQQQPRNHSPFSKNEGTPFEHEQEEEVSYA